MTGVQTCALPSCGPSGNINHYSNEREPLTRNSDLYYTLAENERIIRAEEEKERRRLAEEEEEERRRLAEEKEEERRRLAAEEEEQRRLAAEEKRRLAEEEQRIWEESDEGYATRMAHEEKIIGGKRKSKKTRKN